MKFVQIILIIGLIFVVVLFSGCVAQDNSCPNKCKNEDQLKQNIEEYFSLNPNSYTIKCSECIFERGGYIKAKIEKDKEPLELYYSWGWCSSGGTDCGWYMCFTSLSEKTDDVYESVKNKFCNQISSKQLNSNNIPYCTAEAYDNTKEVKNQCLAGEFEKIEGSKKSLAIDQISERCKDRIAQGNFDCWNRGSRE